MSTSRPVADFSQAEIERLRTTFVELIPYVGSLREKVFTTDLVGSGALPKEAEDQEQAILSFLAEAIDQATGRTSSGTDSARPHHSGSKGCFDYRSIVAMKIPVIETLSLCVRPRFSREDKRLWESFFTQMASEREQESGRRASGLGLK